MTEATVLTEVTLVKVMTIVTLVTVRIVVTVVMVVKVVLKRPVKLLSTLKKLQQKVLLSYLYNNGSVPTEGIWSCLHSISFWGSNLREAIRGGNLLKKDNVQMALTLPPLPFTCELFSLQ